MSPRMEADFSWTEVQATTPIYEKGDYEITIKKVRGRAWEKKDKAGNPTGDVTKLIEIIPEMVGVYDSKGKLKTSQNGKEIKGQPCEPIPMWLTTQGALRMSKRSMMAICGYNPADETDEKKFDAFLKSASLDLKFNVVEREDGEGLTLEIGDGYEKLLVGKNVRASMEPEMRDREGADPVEQQRYTRLSPLGAAA